MHPLCLAALLACLAPSVALVAQTPLPTVYTADPSHSLLDFTIRLVGFNRVRGTFGAWRANIAYDPKAPSRGFVAFEAEVRSIHTQVEERDHHLQSPDFFDAARFPRISFEGRLTPGPDNRLDLEGDLVIRDSTRRIRLPVELATPEGQDQFGNRRLVFSTTIGLSRHDFGVVGPRFWSRAIADSVFVEIELAGRVWDYRSLGFGRKTAVYGPAIVAAADSGRFDAAIATIRKAVAEETDSTLIPTDSEAAVTTGRLIQGGKLREALAAATLFEPVSKVSWSEAERSNLGARKGEILLRLGRTAAARRAFEEALTLDPSNTTARAWRWVAESSTRNEDVPRRR